MGTINYFTSDYITLGVNCNNIESDDDYIFINDDYDQIKYLLEKERFYYFNIALKPGYYEGFSLDIEFNFAYYFDFWQDRRDALKEITRIYKFLLQCINDFGIVAVSPGWCTAYYTRDESIQRLKAAIKEMRATVKKTPTWRQILEAGEIW